MSGAAKSQSEQAPPLPPPGIPSDADMEEDGDEDLGVDASARNEDLRQKRQRMIDSQAADSAKRYAFLLGQTDMFKHFIDVRAQNDANFARQVELAQKQARSTAKAANNGKGKTASDRRHRKTEQEEDRELLRDEEGEDEDEKTVFTESPFYIKGTLRDYQVQGLNWLVSLYENGINGILADEMGLGKTLQTISFLGYLRFFRNIKGPHLVTVPKSTVDNWAREFKQWCPDFNVLVFQGSKEDRQALIHDRLLMQDFDVCITSYEMVLRERTHFKKFAWEYIIIDEAHRIKNEESMLSQVIRLLTSRNRLLITGTPLQNNMHELWALLNFLLPDVFSDSSTFDSWFESEGDGDKVVAQLHKVLRPFLLRRVKADVEKSLKPKREVNLYVKLTKMQKEWYRNILERDIEAINGITGKREGKTRLLNIVMQLRKCCNHPYLFDGAEPGPPFTNGEHLVENSGKMKLLDALLKRMKAQGSRVLIFSQMSRQIDILEDYCFMREYGYCRIDGQTAHEDRIAAIDDFNRPDSDKFIFLLTTRAGGLGINLTTADIVVLYDSDWNPQADLQAMDRAHRIGQTKQVYVFRFVVEGAIEEKVLERAAQKLRLDQLVIQQGRTQSKKEGIGNSKEDLLGMIQHGAQDIFDKADDNAEENDASIKDQTIDFDEIFRQGEERTSKLNQRFEQLGLDELQKFTSDSAYEWDGKDYHKKPEQHLNATWISSKSRPRNAAQYSINKAYSNVFRAEPKPKAPARPKQVHIQDFQFYPQRLHDLQEKELAYFRKQQGYKVPDTTNEADRDLEQHEIDNAEPLTESEIAEKEELSTQGFNDWNKRHFNAFVHGSSRFGRNAYAEIAAYMGEKSVEEVKEYAQVFWENYRSIEGYHRMVAQVVAGETRLDKQRTMARLLHEKVTSYKSPLQQIKFQYSQSKGRAFNEEEDRFLAVKLDEHGLDREDVYERIRDDLRESPLFMFDWFIKSRTVAEIQRRCQTLLTCIKRELDGASNGANRPKQHILQDDSSEEEEDEKPAKRARTGANTATAKGGSGGGRSSSSRSRAAASRKGKKAGSKKSASRGSRSSRRR